MNKFLVLIVFVSLQSCQFFDKKVPDEKELLQQELKKNQLERSRSMAIIY